MSPSPADPTAMMGEILAALKTLQTNQAQLSSSVDAISGRVNVLAGMKEVHDVANSNTPTTGPKKIVLIPSIDASHTEDETKIPESPSLPATHVDGAAIHTDVSHARKHSTGTSRIILT
jgi:hypothetical protein